MRYAIEYLDVSKTFHNLEILKSINLGVEPGTVLTIVGSNGAGKTTLLKMAASLVAPSAGRVLIHGGDAARSGAKVKCMIGFAPSEERSFYWRLTGRQNLRFFATLYGLGGKEAEGRIDRLLDAAGLDAKGDTAFREYSAGMKQALGIARAMLHDPPVLLLDEPTRSLSPDAAGRMRKLIRRKAEEEGKCVLMAAHDFQDLERPTDRIAVLHNGEIRAAGPLAALEASTGKKGAREIFFNIIGQDLES